MALDLDTWQNRLEDGDKATEQQQQVDHRLGLPGWFFRVHKFSLVVGHVESGWSMFFLIILVEIQLFLGQMFINDNFYD